MVRLVRLYSTCRVRPAYNINCLCLSNSLSYLLYNKIESMQDDEVQLIAIRHEGDVGLGWWRGSETEQILLEALAQHHLRVHLSLLRIERWLRACRRLECVNSML